MKRASLVVAACLVVLPLAVQKAKPNRAASRAAPAAASIPAPELKAFKARSIGPALMGGRVSDIALDPVNPFAFWVGLATGGVMKSANAGATFEAVFEKERVASIGAVAVAPSDPKTVWVGTGEPNDRNSSGWGDGVYRSTDGGATWANVGLGTSTAIARIVVHPGDPKTAYVCALGSLWQPGGERGLFKTTDGGATWKKLSAGLPARTQRIGLDVFRKNPKIVYAIVQTDEGGASPIRDTKSKRGGVFRSEDGGETWTRKNPLDPRPFYFSQIRVDPANDQRVWVLGIQLHVSDDGGATFREDLSARVHPDGHAMVIDPKSPKRILLGTDGGLYMSLEGGKNWQHLDRFAGGEYYRITLDDSVPYRIAGGLQDNLNWIGPSATRTRDGIVNGDWTNIGGGDGFYNVFDPDDRDVVYGESQGGSVFRMNLRTGERKHLRPEAAEGQQAFRFHWCAPFLGSLHEKGVMYLAGNRVFRLTRKGEEWALISPDLSARDPEKIFAAGSGAENYGVVYALAESPVKAGLLWAGTDDGKLWVTSDGGKKWSDLTAGLPRAARGEWIQSIEASPSDANVAYVVVSAYRTGNQAPLIWRTADLGKGWTSVAGNLPSHGPAKVVREHPKNPDLLFAGTEFGLFVSLDRGRSWTAFGGLPTVAVDDLKINPETGDLVVATHGRSLYIIDDVSPLSAATAEERHKDAWLFPPRPVFGAYRLPGWSEWNGKAFFRGENPPEGALLTWWLREFTGDEVRISITNERDFPVATLKVAGTPGFGRVAWNLHPIREGDRERGGGLFGPQPRFVPPGEYTVTLTHGQTKVKQKLKVTIAEGIDTR